MTNEFFSFSDDCSTEPIPFMPLNPMFGEAYTPFQQPGKTFCLEDALARGTIFPILERPYIMPDPCKNK